MEKILITGMAGSLGRLLARRLRAHCDVCGVDSRTWQGRPPGIRLHRADLRKRTFEDAMRTESPDAVVHMAFAQRTRDPRVRYDMNVRGTRQLLDHCARFGVGRILVLSSGNAYGAAPDNSFLIHEDRPLSASRSYPEIRDLVEMDTLAGAAIWRHPEISISILRPVNILGVYSKSPMSSYLRRRRVPVPMGFDPLMQFIHEEDVVEAIVLALQHNLRGVWNVVGPGQVPLGVAIRECGGTPIPIPEFLVRPLFERMARSGNWPYPPGVIDYLKYPVILSGERFAAATQFTPLFGLSEIFEAMRS